MLNQGAEARVVLVGRPGCHLCDDARAVVQVECARTGTPWSEVSVTDDPALLERYAELVPVVLVDGEQVAFHRVTAEVLREALSDDGDGRPRWLRRWSRAARSGS